MFALFASSKNRTFTTALSFAEELLQKLRWVPNCTNGMDRIVEYFQIISPVEDAMREYDKRDLEFKDQKKQKFIDELQKFLSRNGRCLTGWNRTNPGEQPTTHNVYINMLVPYDELFYTRKVAEHLSRRNNAKGEVDYALKEGMHGKWNETGLIEHEFVNPFMHSGYKKLQRIVQEYNTK